LGKRENQQCQLRAYAVVIAFAAIAEMGQAQTFHPDIPRAWDDAMGHVIRTVGEYFVPLGAGQAVMSVPGGVHFGASDPRKDGAAVPENPDFK
jgi:hypothetical protein